MPEEKDVFAELATEEPDRGEVESDDEEDLSRVPHSASSQEGMSPNDSDLQTIFKRLNPTFKEEELNDIAPIIMQGRVFPDNFFNKVNLLAIESILKNRHSKNFSYIHTVTKLEGICQIGYMGKNRVEELIASGNTKEQAEAESNRGIS